jgi:hypothetical protein
MFSNNHAVSSHLSEGSVVRHGGSITRREGGDEQWRQSVAKVVRVFPSLPLPFLPASPPLLSLLLMASVIASVKVLELQNVNDF